MKATLEFDLSDELDELAYKEAFHARAMALALDKLHSYLRSQLKYRELKDVTANQLIEDIWDEFHEIAGFVLEAME